MAALTAVAVLLLAALAPAAPLGTHAQPDLHRHRCGNHPVRFCGSISVPLDWQHPSVSPRIRVSFHWWPAADGHARGTIVAVEGGPGYPSTQSAFWYRGQYGSDLRDHNLLLVDNRGTGASSAIDCPALQTLSATASPRAVQSAAYSCGRALDHRWKYRNGRWVHAADMFGSVAAADDMAALLRALHTGPVSIYGDSYGTFFVQVFAEQHPALVKDAVLDSAYQVRHLAPWYRSTMSGLQRSFNHVCTVALACRKQLGGHGWAVVKALVARLDKKPVNAVVPNAWGQRRRVRVTATGIVNLVSDAGADSAIYRALPAAAEAVVKHRDAAPLARLYAQRLWLDESYARTPYRQYSAGLYTAVSCTDYTQLFSMRDSFAARERQLNAAKAHVSAHAFSPFTVDQWLAQNFNTEALTVCLHWPRVTAGTRSAATAPAKRLAPHVPVLILSGELDIWTPAAGDGLVARQIGGHVKIVHFANATHVVGEEDTACGDTVVREFTAHPFAHLDSSCAAKIPAIHAVGSFPSSLAAVPQLLTTLSQSAGTAGQLAVAAVDTAGDAVSRYEAVGHTHDLGLYAGTVIASHGGTRLTLVNDRLIPGVSVAGTVTIAGNTIGRYRVRATLSAQRVGHPAVSVTASWNNGTDAYATTTVTEQKLKFSGRTPAP